MSNPEYHSGQRPTLSRGRPFFILMRRGIVLLLFLLLFAAPVFALEPDGVVFDEETKAICNKVMLNIYYQVLADKDKYPELSQFSEKNLFENEKGIYAVVYQWAAEASAKSPFEFGITIVPKDNTIFQDQGQYAFDLEFPFLGLKFAGYAKKGYKNKYNILPVINVQGIPLSDYQQKFVPLQLRLVAKKTEYKVKESIEFDVEIKNTSKRHMWVKAIQEDTLYCLFDDHFWGAQARGSSKQSKVILKSGDSLTRTFLGRGLNEPKDVEIYCSYGMSIGGVKPSGVLRIKVVK